MGYSFQYFVTVFIVAIIVIVFVTIFIIAIVVVIAIIIIVIIINIFYYFLIIFFGVDLLHRRKRQTPNANTCPLVIVADYRFYQGVGSSDIYTTALYMVSWRLFVFCIGYRGRLQVLPGSGQQWYLHNRTLHGKLEVVCFLYWLS